MKRKPRRENLGRNQPADTGTQASILEMGLLGEACSLRGFVYAAPETMQSPVLFLPQLHSGPQLYFSISSLCHNPGSLGDFLMYLATRAEKRGIETGWQGCCLQKDCRSLSPFIYLPLLAFSKSIFRDLGSICAGAEAPGENGVENSRFSEKSVVTKGQARKDWVGTCIGCPQLPAFPIVEGCVLS